MFTNNQLIVLFIYIIITSITHLAWAGCYFPHKLQGEFLTQSLTSREIAYTSLGIQSDSIPTWGTCHQRIGHHHVIINRQGETRDHHDPCFKCLKIVSRSLNVIQLHMNGGLERCYDTEDEAEADCPTPQQIQERKSQEMMLYKTQGFYGSSAITKTYCPLNGNYKFTYSINDGTEADLECQEALSEASDCPTGYKFNLHFRGCTFPNFDMSFQCLGSWSGENGETYLSLLDTQLPQLGEEPRPRYRCALFKEDPFSGLIHMALSSDSTCVNNLYSAQDGFETLHLEKQIGEKISSTLALPSSSSMSSSTTLSSKQPDLECIFPDWMQGQWEGLTIDGGKIIYRDEDHFQTYRGNCVVSTIHTDRFVVDLTTDCGSQAHFCALFQQRDVNVMEFQLGESSSPLVDVGLCNAENFSPSKWLTLGRSQIPEMPKCPLVGEFTGVIPDEEGLCTRSYTDCNNPEVMFYTVFNCNNATEIYEEREYRCYGQWEEDGLVYTYLQRRDLPENECFVGITLDEDSNLVTEAGENCERGHQPEKYGMTLRRQSKCSRNDPNLIQPNFQSIDLVSNNNNNNIYPYEKSSENSKVSHSQIDGGGHSRVNRPYNEDDIFTKELPGSASPSLSSPTSSANKISLALSLSWLINLLLFTVVIFG